MMTWTLMITPFMVILSIICVIMQRQHLLMALLALEAMILSLILLIITMMNMSWSMIIIIMLTFGACEASLGLACMTAMSRSYGNDRINSLSINKC